MFNLQNVQEKKCTPQMLFSTLIAFSFIFSPLSFAQPLATFENERTAVTMTDDDFHELVLEREVETCRIP